MAEEASSDPEAQVEYSRQEARNLVQNHLYNHTDNNPGRSSDYVTWIATLHPENADVTIDQRFFVPGNPWWSIYEDTKNNVPTATAVAIDDDSATTPQQQQQESNSTTTTSNNGAMKDIHQPNQYPSLCLSCSPVDTFAGILVLAFAIMGVLLSELFALFLCYIPAFILYHTANIFSPPNVLTGLFYSFFMIFYYACALGDSICLVTSVLVTEIVAAVGYLTSLCTGGVLMARFWHQYIRRVCHGIRIGLRNKSYCFSNPTRDFLLCTSNNREFERQSDGQSAPVSALVQQVPAGGERHSGSGGADSRRRTAPVPSAPPVTAVVTHQIPPEHVTVKE